MYGCNVVYKLYILANALCLSMNIFGEGRGKFDFKLLYAIFAMINKRMRPS